MDSTSGSFACFIPPSFTTSLTMSHYLTAHEDSTVQEQSRVQVGVVPIDVVSMEQAIERVARCFDLRSNGPFIISGVNAHFVNIAQEDSHLASYLENSDLNVADGMSLIIASRLLQPG